MTDRPPRATPRRLWAGGLTLALALLAALALGWAPPVLARWQERGFDQMIRLLPPPARGDGPLVLVVDIGARDDAGAPWDRAASARLAAALARGKPAAVGWDILFSGSCNPGQTANIALAAALARAPTALGFLLSSAEQLPPAAPGPVLAISDPPPPLWAAPGAEMPCPAFAMAAAGLGAASLPGDVTARVRLVPAAVSVGGTPWPSLPVEVLRLAQHLPTPLVAGPASPTLQTAQQRFALDPLAMLRFRPTPRAARADRTVDAAALLAGHGADRLAGAVVLVGSSLPQRGGLRPTAEDPLYPSVQIAADVTEGLLAGRLPWRPDTAPLAEAAAILAAGGAVALLVASVPPLGALAAALALAALWASGAGAGFAATGRLYDPVLPALALVLATLAGLLLQAAATFRAERILRGRMGQLLPGPVIARLIANPRLLRLGGERRQVTALFTDIEGFSATANALPPEALIAVLDRYFSAVSAIVLRHGGMIDKIVGDGVHALFNAPLDQPDHVNAALAAAAAIQDETESLRPVLGLGRTRIGVETGPVVLGDVGSGARIDYTAHGPSVNLAARLQEAAKTLGPAVIIGPAAATAATGLALRPLGAVQVRSFGSLDLFTLP